MQRHWSVEVQLSDTIHLLTSGQEQAKLIQDLTPDTLCTFSPDPSEQQPDARWSAVGDDEDMESNVLYAVASPGILRLWPWVNQVCFRPQRLSNGQNPFSQPRIRRLSQSPPRCPLRSLCSSLNAWGMCDTFFFASASYMEY